MHSAKKIEKKNRVLQGVCLRKNVLFLWILELAL